MNNFKIKPCAVLTFCLFTTLPAMASAQTEPKYDCTAAETKQYIEQVSYNLFAPSPLSTPKEFKDAFMQREQKAAEQGDPAAQNCVTIFTDGKLIDEWKEMIDKIRNFSVDIDFTSPDAAALRALLDKAKKMAQEQLAAALSALGEDICKLLSTDYLKGLMLDAINEKYGTNARNLRVADFAAEVKEMALDSLDDDVQLLMSPEDIDDEISSEASDEISKQRKKLWDKF